MGDPVEKRSWLPVRPMNEAHAYKVLEISARVNRSLSAWEASERACLLPRPSPASQPSIPIRCCWLACPASLPSPLLTSFRKLSWPGACYGGGACRRGCPLPHDVALFCPGEGAVPTRRAKVFHVPPASTMLRWSVGRLMAAAWSSQMLLPACMASSTKRHSAGGGHRCVSPADGWISVVARTLGKCRR